MKMLPIDVQSCVYKYLINISSNQCNNFGNQNQNIYMAVRYVSVKTNTNIQRIYHEFLISGHTQTGCDTNHSVIEQNKIQHPHD